MKTYRKVIDKHGGRAAFVRLTGLPYSTVQDLYNGKTSSAMARLLFEILDIAPAGIIKSAADRAKG